MFGSAASAFPAYFREASSGLIDIGGAETFGVASVTDPGVVQDIVQQPDSVPEELRRGRSAAAALTVAEGIDAGDLRRFDGLVFVVMGRAVGAGFSAVHVGGKVMPTAFLDDRGSHSFMTHEIGHVVGLDHSYQPGWSNPEGRFYGEYGDPTDPMSAETWGGTAATSLLAPDPAADVDTSATFWMRSGPAISTTTLWRHLPGFPEQPPWVRMLPPDAPPTELSLRAPNRGGVTLVAMPRPQGGWWTVEYRPSVGWDQGLQWDPDHPTKAPGIVVHEIRDLGTGMEHKSYPRRSSVCYVGTLPVPSTGDSDWAGNGPGIRLLRATSDEARLVLGAGLPQHRDLHISVQTSYGIERRAPDRVDWVPLTGPDCSTSLFVMDRVDVPARIIVVVGTTGHTSPRFSFAVNGVVLVVGSARSERGTSSVARRARRYGRWSRPARFRPPSRTPRSPCTGRPPTTGSCSNFPRDSGEFPVEVEVTARDGGGTTTRSVTETVTTASIELSDEAAAAIGVCLRAQLAAMAVDQLPPQVFPVDVGPIDGPDWSSLAGRDLVRTLRQLDVLGGTNPRLARGLRLDIADGLGVAPPMLDTLVELTRLQT